MLRKIYNFFLDIIKFLIDLIVWEPGLIFVYIVVGALIVGWIANLPVFDNKIQASETDFPLNIELVAQLQKGGEISLKNYPAVITKKITQSYNWLGQPIGTNCELISNDSVWTESAYLVSSADRILQQNGIPLRFDSVSSERVNKTGVDCEKTSLDIKVYVRLGGAFSRESDYILISAPNHKKYEWAWVKIPAELYDKVLSAAMNRESFYLNEYYPTKPEVVGAYLSDANDPNNLSGWVSGYKPILSSIYKSNIIQESLPGKTDVTTSRTVITGWHKVRKCNYRGVCSSDIVDDKTTVYDTNSIDVVVGQLTFETP